MLIGGNGRNGNGMEEPGKERRNTYQPYNIRTGNHRDTNMTKSNP
jgi:hypothetical protein